MYHSIDEIDVSELKFLAASNSVSITPALEDKDVEWMAQFEETDGSKFGIRITGYGATIEHALRALYWKLVNNDK